jgi:hypothetical protein
VLWKHLRTIQFTASYAALRNLQKLELEDFREVIKAQFSPTLRERYLTVNYHRAAFNVEMMVNLKETKQFQTLSLLSRTIFELAVEIKSIMVRYHSAFRAYAVHSTENRRQARAASVEDVADSAGRGNG